MWWQSEFISGQYIRVHQLQLLRSVNDARTWLLFSRWSFWNIYLLVFGWMINSSEALKYLSLEMFHGLLWRRSDIWNHSTCSITRFSSQELKYNYSNDHCLKSKPNQSWKDNLVCIRWAHLCYSVEKRLLSCRCVLIGPYWCSENILSWLNIFFKEPIISKYCRFIVRSSRSTDLLKMMVKGMYSHWSQ